MTGDKGQARQRLLDATMKYVVAHGVGDMSLRQLAAAVGTSHRMLVYHFGSKQGLLIEVIQAVEEQQRQALASLLADPGAALPDRMLRFWAVLADPSLWPAERLFFEMYGQALQGRPHTAALLDGVVESWLGPITELCESAGMPARTARARARLGVAVTRGLLLDLLATGDRQGADDAMAEFMAMQLQAPELQAAELQAAELLAAEPLVPESTAP